MADSSSASPSSPGRGPTRLSECIEELVRFTLSVGIEREPEVELGLSKEFVATLLEDDADDLNVNALPSDFRGDAAYEEGTCGGVPRYPLHKQLSKALLSCIVSGTFPGESDCMAWIKEDENLISRIEEWIKLLVENGQNLVNMLQGVSFELHVQEPYYSQLRAGKKTVEGRCAVGEFKSIAPGSLLLLNKCLLLHVEDVNFYGSFAEMMETKGLANVLPRIQTIEEGVQVYRKFYTKEKEKSNGVVGISVSKPSSQPYVCIAKIISGLSYEGLGSLLGLKYTSGTAADGLPPPRTALTSSFVARHNPHFANGRCQGFS